MEAEVVVVGGGMIGSSIARHVSEAGIDVTVVSGRSGSPPWSSHDDDTRITRILDTSLVWAELARRSIDAYRDIERRSGVRFHHPVGVLWVGSDERAFEDMSDVRHRFHVPVEHAPDDIWTDGLSLPDGDTALLERGHAGYIEPRRMIAAQTRLARAGGATWIRDTAVGLERRGDRWRIALAGGEPLVADRVAVAAGAGAGFLLDVPVVPTAECVLLVELEPDVGERWEGRPVVGRLDGGVVDAYLTPPTLVGGRWLMKLGSERAVDEVLGSPAAVSDWMSGASLGGRRTELESTVERIFPELHPIATSARPCLYARTPNRRPLIIEREPGLVVAGGGNGRAAKSSDAIGAIAAELVTTGEWHDPLPATELTG